MLTEIVTEWKDEFGQFSEWLYTIKNQKTTDEELTIKLREGDILQEKVHKLQEEVWAVARFFAPAELEELLAHIALLLETCVKGMAIVETAWKVSQYDKERDSAAAKAAKKKHLEPATQRVYHRYPSLDSSESELE